MDGNPTGSGDVRTDRTPQMDRMRRAAARWDGAALALAFLLMVWLTVMARAGAA